MNQIRQLLLHENSFKLRRTISPPWATSATSTPLALAIAPNTVKITKPEKKLVKQSIKGTIRASLGQ